VFRIFDAVDLYPHLQNLTDMRPVVVNPSISFTQLVQEMLGASDDQQRQTIREQLVVKLRRRLGKLTYEACRQFEATAGETPEATLQRLLSNDVSALVAWLKNRAAIGSILDGAPEGQNPRFIPISHHEDKIAQVVRGYGAAEKPEDFLDSFTAFVRDNLNKIAALKLVVQRPRDLTRADLKALRMALDEKGYSDANLRRAWADTKNEDIAASIIGFVRQAALGDALIPYEDRVHTAMRTILASRVWTEPQKRWLNRIGEQIVKEIVVDSEAIDREPFIADGGFTRLNKVFGGELKNILASINEELWKKIA
jgi:type I restriction enzyme R subunit